MPSQIFSKAGLGNVASRIKQVCRSSYGVAALFSLGFHGLLFTIGPRVSSLSFDAFAEGEAVDSTVPLVTLNEADRARIPDFSQPQRRFDSIDLDSGLPNLDSSLPQADVKIPTPPAPTFRSSFSPSYRLPITRTPSTSRFGSANRTTRLTIPGAPRFGTTSRDILERQQEIERRRAAELAEESAAPAEVSPAESSAEASGTGTAADLVPPSSEASDDPAAPDEAPEVAVNTETSEHLAKLRQLQSKFTYSAENTTEEAAAENYENWLDQTAEDSDTVLTDAEPQEISLNADLRLCADNPPTTGQIGLVVAPDGTLTDTTILRSTGYEYLNQAAIDSLSETDFPETDTATRYPITVLVEYDEETCSQPQVLENSDQEQASRDAQP